MANHLTLNRLINLYTIVFIVINQLFQMNITDAKEMLKTKGYCSFNLKDFNTDYYDFFDKNLKCNVERNIKSSCTLLRADYNEINNNFNGPGSYRQPPYIPKNVHKIFPSFEEAKVVKDEIVGKHSENINQIWYSTSGLHDVSMEGYDPQRQSDTIREIYLDIVKEFFGIEANANPLSNFTYYETDCVLQNHSDGTGTGRICACLIYLNETYDESNGGILILDNEHKVVPIIGNVAIIDLMSFDIQHQVTKVTGGDGRYAVLSFVMPKK